MGYRDADAAAWLQVAVLERRLRNSAARRPWLRRYRRALLAERRALEHAIRWYENGSRFGFAVADAVDPLAPARLHAPAAKLRMPSRRGPALLRMRALEQLLAERADALRPLELSVDRLIKHCGELRRVVEDWAKRFSEHPPPCEPRTDPALLALVISLFGMAALGAQWLHFALCH